MSILLDIREDLFKYSGSPDMTPIYFAGHFRKICTLKMMYLYGKAMTAARLPVSAYMEFIIPSTAKLVRRLRIGWKIIKNQQLGCIFWGVGDHGGGPSRVDLNNIEEFCRENKNEMAIIHSYPEAYCHEAQERKYGYPIWEKGLNHWGAEVIHLWCK